MKEEPKKLSLFDIVGIYSSGVKTTLKATKAPMETTYFLFLFNCRTFNQTNCNSTYFEIIKIAF